MRQCPLPICPAILEHEDAESIFQAIQEKHPVELFSRLSASHGPVEAGVNYIEIETVFASLNIYV